MNPAELHKNWWIVAIQVMFFHPRLWLDLQVPTEAEPPDQPLVDLRDVMKMPNLEEDLRVQQKMAQPVTVRESPPPKHDDALKCLPPDSSV